MASIEKSPRVDAAKLASEVARAPPIKRAPLVSSEPTHEYVEHLEERLRVTAEAVKRNYESAAEEFEALGGELISAARKWEAATADARNTVRDAAEEYRQEGKKIFERMQECVLLTENVRKTCDDVKRRMIKGNGRGQ